MEKNLLDPEDIINKLTELEDRSRRNNLLIDGIAEANNGSWENCEEQLQKIIKEKLKIEKNIEIDVTEQVKNKATVLEQFFAETQNSRTSS